MTFDEIAANDAQTRQVQTDGFEVPRDRLGASAWTLEPSGVVALLEKIRRAGIPLNLFAGTVPLMGIKTGFNDAFLLDTPQYHAIVRAYLSRAAEEQAS